MKLQSDLGRDKIVPLILKLAVPAMLAQLVNVLYGIIDRMFIGHIPVIGSVALAGVGICAPIVSLITSFGTLVGIGGSIFMAIKMGAQDKKAATAVLGNSFKLLLVFSLVTTILFMIFKEPLIYFFGASESTFIHANTYLTIYTIGSTFAIMSMGLSYFITCQGFANITMFVVVFGAVCNIALDALFIFVFNMGVAGAAWATVISQFLGFTFALLFLLSKVVPISIKNVAMNYSIVKHVIRLGICPFIILALDSMIIIIMNISLKAYGGPATGDMMISAFTIMQSYLFLIIGPLLGISSGTQAILSYNYGAQRYDRIRLGIKYIFFFAALLTSSMYVATHFIAEPFVSLFTTNNDIKEIAISGIFTFTLAVIPLGFQYVVVDGLTALTRVKTALFLSVMRKTLFIAATLIIPYFFALENVFYAEPLSDFTGAIISMTVFLLVFNKVIPKK